MRTPILALTILLGTVAFVTGPAAPAAAAESTFSAAALEAQQPPQVDIEVRDARAWYMSPVWIAIGVIALVVLILLIVMAARGGGTTVIRD